MRFEYRPVDQLTFESEKNQKISPVRTSKLARYILRHLAPPDQNYYAFDCSVRIERINYPLRIATMLIRETTGPESSQLIPVDLRYNDQGFFLTNADKYRPDVRQQQAVIESGYLLGGAEPFDLDLAGYISQLAKEQVLAESLSS